MNDKSDGLISGEDLQSYGGELIGAGGGPPMAPGEVAMGGNGLPQVPPQQVGAGGDSSGGQEPDEDSMTDEDVVFTAACMAIELGDDFSRRHLAEALSCEDVYDARLAVAIAVLKDDQALTADRFLELLGREPSLVETVEHARATMEAEEAGELGEVEAVEEVGQDDGARPGEEDDEVAP